MEEYNAAGRNTVTYRKVRSAVRATVSNLGRITCCPSDCPMFSGKNVCVDGVSFLSVLVDFIGDIFYMYFRLIGVQPNNDASVSSMPSGCGYPHRTYVEGREINWILKYPYARSFC